MRKIIQLAASVVQVGEVTAPVAFVLTDDGKVWTTVPSRTGDAPTWKELPPIPQAEAGSNGPLRPFER